MSDSRENGIYNLDLVSLRPDDSPGVRGSSPILLDYNEEPDPQISDDWKVVNVSGQRFVHLLIQFRVLN